jgi:hypothetical protein
MTDKQTIFLTWLVIFTVAFMGMVAVQEHVNSINIEPVDTVVLNGKWLITNITHQRGTHFDGNGDYVDINTTDGTWITVNHTCLSDDFYHVSSYKVLSSEPQLEQSRYNNESQFVVNEPDSVDSIPSTYTVLESNGFYDWSEQDKELLTQMMQVTATKSSGFEEFASTAPVHVLETYIDLLESAGY